MLRNVFTIGSLLFLAAHELRTGNSVGCGLWLFAILLVFSSWRFRHLTLALLLAFGTWLWADTTIHLAGQRLAHEQPWLRLAAILGSVTLTCLAGTILNTREALRNRKR